MPLSAGLSKQVAYKVETTFGTLPTASAAQSLRRVQSTLDLSKDTYQSNEIRTDLQISDFRHGVRRVKGGISGELSAKTYADFIGAALKRDFAAVAAITAASVTIAGAGPTYTIARAAGSYLTDGIKIGDVIRLSVGSLNAANLAKNLMVTAVTALSISVVVLNASALVAEGPVTGTTITGLTHLEDEFVVAMVDGISQGNKTVTSGAVTITAGNEVWIGKSFTSIAKSLPPEAGSAFGTSHGAIKQVKKMKARILNSLGFSYGWSGATLNSKTALELNSGQSSNFVTDTVELIPNAPYHPESQWTIQTSEPYPLNLLSMSLVVECGE